VRVFVCVCVCVCVHCVCVCVCMYVHEPTFTLYFARACSCAPLHLLVVEEVVMYFHQVLVAEEESQRICLRLAPGKLRSALGELG
jgi:hypothetical protein